MENEKCKLVIEEETDVLVGAASPALINNNEENTAEDKCTNIKTANVHRQTEHTGEIFDENEIAAILEYQQSKKTQKLSSANDVVNDSSKVSDIKKSSDELLLTNWTCLDKDEKYDGTNLETSELQSFTKHAAVNPLKHNECLTKNEKHITTGTTVNAKEVHDGSSNVKIWHPLLDLQDQDSTQLHSVTSGDNPVDDGNQECKERKVSTLPIGNEDTVVNKKKEIKLENGSKMVPLVDDDVNKSQTETEDNNKKTKSEDRENQIEDKSKDVLLIDSDISACNQAHVEEEVENTATQSKSNNDKENKVNIDNDESNAIEVDEVEKKKKEKTPLVELAEKGMGIADILTETGEFAYISLVAVALATTFNDKWHRSWKDNYIKTLCKHLKTKRGVEKTMLQFLHEDLKPLHVHAYVEILKDDWMIRDNSSIIAQDLLGITMETGDYDARSRVIIYHIAKLMAVPSNDVIHFENMIVESFVQEEVIESEEQKAEKAKRSRQTKVKRYLAIGAATVGGGALIGLTGGLAAPLVASAGVALFGSGAAFLGTTAGLAIMASMFGAAGAGLGGYKMKRRVGAIEEFEFAALGKGKDLHVVIAVSGWLTRDRLDNYTVPWLALAESKEQYTLKWESKYLKNLGDGLEYIMDSVMTMAAKEALKYTVLAGLLAAITLPAAAYGALSAIDNPWSIVTRRSVETGKELAEVLLQRLQGKRPVTLIGFSMGARVIFSALQELSIRKGSEGIVENVVLLGAPITSSVKSWLPLEKVVSGRIINGYCRGDWLLQFVYRTASVQVTNIAGLGPVNWDNRLMENVDLTDIVDGHLDYSEKIDEILGHIGLKTIPRSSSPLLRENSCEAKEKEECKIDVCDLLLPKSQKVSEMSAGISRSGSINSYLSECDKTPAAAASICKSASFSGITIHEGQSAEDQRVSSSENAVLKKSKDEGIVEIGCEPIDHL